MKRANVLPASVAASAAGAATFAALLLAACSSGSSGTSLLTVPLRDAGGSDTTVKSSDGGAEPDGAPVLPFDASADQPAIDTLCAEARLLGMPTEAIAYTFSVYPAFGGTVVPGTYELEGLESYAGGLEGVDGGAIVPTDGGGDDDGDDSGLPASDGGEPPPSEMAAAAFDQKTLELDSDGLFSLASATGTVDAGVGPTTITAGVYVVAGSTLVLHATCPSTSTTTYSFTASGGQLLLFGSTVPTTVETYQMVATP